MSATFSYTFQSRQAPTLANKAKARDHMGGNTAGLDTGSAARGYAPSVACTKEVTHESSCRLLLDVRPRDAARARCGGGRQIGLERRRHPPPGQGVSRGR